MTETSALQDLAYGINDLREDVAPCLADVVNRSLGTCPENEKMKDLEIKHRRPKMSKSCMS